MNINNILNEEISRFLNESYIMNDERFSFKQRLNNSHFQNYKAFTTEFDTDIRVSDIIVNWGISFWLNQSGIENFIVEVTSVEGQFTMEMYDKQSDELKQETPKNIQDFEWKFVIGEASVLKGGSMYIESLEFDFQNKTCNVLF